MNKRLLFLAISFVFASKGMLSAQQVSCVEKWDEAQLAFSNGHLYGIPSLLSGCLDNGFSKLEKIEAYRLLTITYLYIDDPFGAQNSFLNLLKLDPEYRIKVDDPVELEHLSNNFITSPIISWRVSGGPNYSFIDVIHKYSSGNDDLNTEKYTPLVGLTVGGSLDVHFNKVISMGIDAVFSTNAYKYTNKLFNLDSIQNAKDPHEFREVAYNIGLPVYLKLTYPGIKYYPYIYGGYSPTYNVRTVSAASYTIIEAESQVPLENKTLNISPVRKKFSNSIIIGAGVKRRINYHYVFLDLRFSIGLDNLLNRDNRFKYEQYEEIRTYGLRYKKIDSDFRESSLTLTLGWVWPQYKPRKKKEVTFRSFVGGIFKKKTKDD